MDNSINKLFNLSERENNLLNILTIDIFNKIEKYVNESDTFKGDYPGFGMNVNIRYEVPEYILTDTLNMEVIYLKIDDFLKSLKKYNKYYNLVYEIEDIYLKIRIYKIWNMN